MVFIRRLNNRLAKARRFPCLALANTMRKSIEMGLSLLKMDEMQLELCQFIAKKCWGVAKRKIGDFIRVVFNWYPSIL
jgi:hypothetical protein